MNTSFQEIEVLDWPTYYTLMLVVPIVQKIHCKWPLRNVHIHTAKCDCVIGMIPIEVGRCSDFETIETTL